MKTLKLTAKDFKDKESFYKEYIGSEDISDYDGNIEIESGLGKKGKSPAFGSVVMKIQDAIIAQSGQQSNTTILYIALAVVISLFSIHLNGVSMLSVISLILVFTVYKVICLASSTSVLSHQAQRKSVLDEIMHYEQGIYESQKDRVNILDLDERNDDYSRRLINRLNLATEVLVYLAMVTSVLSLA